MAVTMARPVGGRTKVKITGLRGPDPWAEKIQIIPSTNDNSGALTIDYGLGKHVRLTVTRNTTLSVVGWPPDGRVGRLTLNITNSGAYTLTWPEGVIWSAGARHDITDHAGGKDVIVLFTDDGGETIFGNVIGADYH